MKTIGTNDLRTRIESSFIELVRNDKKLKNAYLMVDSEKLNFEMSIAEGETDGIPANIAQPVHMASVGKLFTATLVGILHEKGMLRYDDPIANYLDAQLMDGLHVFKKNDYSHQVTIRHILMQTSGLNDVFYLLLKKMMADESFRVTTREAVEWGKQNLKPVAPPGKRHFYTDTNYYLLGLIVESVTRKSFHETMHELIFEPLGMQNACMYGFSKPRMQTGFLAARLYIKGVDLLSIEGINHIDYAGGSVMAPLRDFNTFMKSLVGHRIVGKETLQRMISDDVYMGFPTVGFNYGYSIWKMKSIPILLPKKYSCWGCVGVTGAFMFFHPETESIVLGSFNDFRYRGKALEFMARKVIKQLLRYHEGKN